MKTVKKDPPSYKDILKFLAYPALAGARVGADGPILPSNVNAFLKYSMNNKDTLTEKDFSKRDMDALLALIQKSEKQNRSDVQYEDYSEKDVRKMDRFSPEGKIMTTLGRFTFNKDDDGSYNVVDEYDFNKSPENISYHAKSLGMSEEDYIDKYKNNPLSLAMDLKDSPIVGRQKSPYQILRYGYAPILSETRDPMPVKIKVKKK